MNTSVNTVQEDITASEIGEARRYLEQTRDDVVAVTNGLSEGQWNYRPATGGWSIAENVEHIAIVQERILGPISQALAECPESVSTEPGVIAAIIKIKFVDRSRKFNAPELVRPAGRWTPAESLRRLSESTLRLIQRLETEAALRRHRIPSPPLNAVTDGAYTLMDGYEWILTAAAHTERHTRQILEIKAEAHFPAN